MGSFTPPPTQALAPGDRLDRYELLCVLAQGGMGTVWLARLTGKLGFERLLAIKTILPSYTNDKQFCAMFLDEAGIAARVDHENVARILEIGEDRGFLYYAMELVDGESLRKLYRDVRTQGQVFPIGVALRTCADLCAGLHAVHELKDDAGRPMEVVHRDVSPQNILITVRGTTKLIDFGVAKARERNTEETTAGTLKGKLEYMAPEQAAGEPLDRRADVYSVGAILYELLSGSPVRDTDDGRQLAALHELVTGAPYTPLPASVPHLVRSVVDRALMRDPNQRYRTADELRHALEQVILATGMNAAVDDVSKTLAHFSRERTQKRKEAIDEAVRAATEGRLQKPADDPFRQDSTIVAPVHRQVGGIRTGPSLAPYDQAPSGMVPAYGVAPSGHHHSGPIAFAPTVAPNQGMMPPQPPMTPRGRGVPGDGPPTGPSIRTMEGASISARPPGFAFPPPKQSSPTRVFAGLFVLGLVALLGVVAGVVIAKRGVAVPTSVAATAAPTTSTTQSVATPTPVPVVTDSAATTAPTTEPAPTAPPVAGLVGASPMPTVTAVPVAAPSASTSASSSRTVGRDAGVAPPPTRRPTGPSTPRGPRSIGGNKPNADDGDYGF